jgi:hypothetical protein
MSGTSSSESPSNPLFDVFKKDSIISSSINSTSDSIRSFYETSFNNNTLFIGLLFVIIFTIIIAYLLYTYIGSQLFAKIKSVVSDTKVPVIGTKLSKFTAELAKNANGSRKSFSFWIYINDMNKYKGQYQTVAAVSSDGEINYNIENCSPYIFLDKNNNTMFIRFTKLDDQSYNQSFNQITSPETLHKFLQTGISIDYIPMQRWVHIAVVCNSNTFKTTLYAYVDGDLVKSISHNESFKLIGYESNYFEDGASALNTNGKINIKNPANNTKFDNINLNMTGYLYVGNSRDYSKGIGPGFYGLLSSFTSYNYELNQQDIYSIYNDGPITGFLAKLGLGAYGVRSPVYKL